MREVYQTSNRYNVETGQWEYAPMNVTIVDGRYIEVERVEADEADEGELR